MLTIFFVDIWYMYKYVSDSKNTQSIVFSLVYFIVKIKNFVEN